MSYLSRLSPDQYGRVAQRDLADPYQMHRTLLRAFPDDSEGGPGRVLYRIDFARDGRAPVVLVQSDKSPDWSRLPKGWSSGEPEFKQFTPRFKKGTRLAFRLRANPTARRRASGKKNGRRIGISGDEGQAAWLRRKGADGGFGIEVVGVINEGAVVCRRSPEDDPLTFLAVRFDGILVVNNPARFAETLVDGLGTGKAFGFGLLSVAAAQ